MITESKLSYWSKYSWVLDQKLDKIQMAMEQSQTGPAQLVADAKAEIKVGHLVPLTRESSGHKVSLFDSLIYKNFLFLPGSGARKTNQDSRA